ncbi:MAG: hypothetical protein JO149_08375, partial [Gammaproteobacteria bacterium]|nr:hypothetical protein [Gammaproteobacteria bacterium]
MTKPPIVSQKNKGFTTGGVALGYDLPEYLVYLFKTLFVKPKVTINFSLETGATEFSDPYFLLSIKSGHKEIGNIEISLVGNLYEINQKKKLSHPFSFQGSIPTIIEAEETAVLQCEPTIDLKNYLHENSTISLNVEYGYMFLNQIYSIVYKATWGFDLKNPVQPSI